MTTPRAARTNSYGQRTYPVPHPETGELHDLPSWSTLKKLLAAPALETWKLKGVARQIALRPDLQMLAADPETVYQAVKDALNANNDKANIGTGIHRFCELSDRGVLDLSMVPTAARAHVDQYVAARERYGWELVEAEVTVARFPRVGDPAGWAGTADRFLRFPGFGVVVADLKTGDSVWPDTAQQLAAYADADCIWAAPSDDDLPEFVKHRTELEHDIAAGANIPKGRKKWSEAAIKAARADLDTFYWSEFAIHKGHRPMPEGLRRDVGVVVHARPDSCIPVLVNLDTEVPAVEVVKSVARIWGWQRGDKAVVLGPMGVGHSPVPEDDDASGAAGGTAAPLATTAEDATQHRAYLIARIRHTHEHDRQASSRILNTWPDGVAKFKDSTQHDAISLRLIEECVDSADAAFGVPFPTFTLRSFKVARSLDEGAAMVAEAFA